MIYHKNLQQILNFQPHQKQIDVIEDKSRFKTLNAGRRFGKSLLGAYLCTYELLQPNKRIWIVAPTYDLTEKIWREVYAWFLKELNPFAKNIFTGRGGWRIETHFNSVLECKSANDPTALIGEGLDLLIIDEASRIKEIAWSEALRPTLADRQGKGVFISTPKGKNWFYKEYLKGTQDNPLYKSWNLKSIDNPYFPKDEWEVIKSELGEDNPTFRQEFLAEFIDDVGSVFRNIRACANGNMEEPKQGVRYFIGADVAKSQDYTVLTVMREDNASVVHWERFNGIGYDVQMIRISELARRYNNATIILDSTGVGDPIYDVLGKSGVSVKPFKFTNTSKDHLIKNLVIGLESQSISYPYIEILINELEAFEYQMSISGNTKYSAPDGLHDDAVISLALAYLGIKKNNSGLLDFYKELNAEHNKQVSRSILNTAYF